MKNFFYFVLTIAVLAIMGGVGYYLYNRMEIDNFEFIQRQTEICKEKYKDEFKDEGYTWYDGTDDFKHITVDVIYSKEAKACLESYQYERGDKKNGGYSYYNIKNLDTQVYYFNCREDDEETYAECIIGCENKKVESCYWDTISYNSGDVLKLSDKDLSNILLESPYYSKLYKYGFINDEQLKALVETIKILANGGND